ncbi:DUF2909 domain-containing protein [Halomonas denitrificans]|uniref:DUF2909 family protein n=1 Tax=Halomonas TaxID=2745 RepID=UPI001A8CD4F4|nr:MULTISPECIES: DUF2909 family protein [Halomonas]MED5294894.1 DUF2909 family protein [Pseudomonadota bacterium]MBN8411150.1 DUF2909 domain-containing protein [Halomonas litopenaei]MBY5925772.1 DUF2909 domain-containing protein [Halomonas sp. DP4Y7-2]MBY5927504.1 DUF2909 domain-containing protein [Halomonas sp. DP8Y7-3]MBY5969592.1 DUF2909 domain-containing protein [Halomonas denitrificans]
MLLKSLILIVFIAMLTSLAAGVGFLLKDDSQSRRLLISLKIRVGLAALLLGLLIYGFASGTLG